MNECTLNELKDLGEQGDLKAQRELGMRFFKGNVGAPRDLAVAEKWWQRAADTNDAWSQCCLGHLARERKDLKKAERWWRKAAMSGEPAAQYSLAWHCADLLGVDEKLKWLRKSASNDYSEAQKFLGFLTFWGMSVDRDKVSGLKWMMLGAEKTAKHAWWLKFVVRFMKWFMSRDEVYQAQLQVQQWKQNREQSSVVRL